MCILIKCALIPVQLLFYISNCIYIIAGVIFIILGPSILYNVGHLTAPVKDTDITFTLVPKILTGMGVVILAIGILGYAGACVGSKMLLHGYVAAMVTILVLQIGLGIHAMKQFPDETSIQSLTDGINNSMKVYDSSEEMRESFDYLHQKLECCGGDGPTDWESLPSSCCKDLSEECSLDKAYNSGCGRKLYEYVRSKIELMGKFAVVVVAFELFGICVASILAMTY